MCELASSALRSTYGPSSASELGHGLAYLNAKRILVFVDPNVQKLEPFADLMTSIMEHGPVAPAVDVYEDIRVEPNNESFQHAVQ